MQDRCLMLARLEARKDWIVRAAKEGEAKGLCEAGWSRLVADSAQTRIDRHKRECEVCCTR